GIYLSGGIDSNIIASSMKKYSRFPVHSFSMSFEHGYSEGALSRDAASRFGFQHHEVTCGVDDILNLHPVVRALEEPIGDAIIVAPYKLSKALRDQGIKVVLAGDGADEVWGGYQFLTVNERLQSWTRNIPGFGISALTKVIESSPNRLISWAADLPFDV